MRLLVTGGNGQLGWELAQLSNSQQIVTTLTRAQLDITNHQQITHALEQYQPDILVNTAAYTAVDKAEQEVEQAYAVNREGPKLLAEICAKQNLPLIHLSTDYVFDGENTKPYLEDDITAPLNIYGESKLAGELVVRESWDKHIILRVSGVFSSHGNNFVKTILRLAKEREVLKIVADQTICPTPAFDIAKVIVEISKNLKNFGTYHYCGAGITTWYEFTQEIIKQAKEREVLAVQDIIPITTAEFPTPAKRPHYSVLDCHKLTSHFGIQQNSWKDGLVNVLSKLTEANHA